MLLPHSFLFRFVSQPPPLRGTSFHRKEGEPCPCTKAFLHGEGSNARIPLSRTVISSVSEKSFLFAVKRCMRVNGNGKPDTPRMWDTVFHADGSAELVRKRIATKCPRLCLGRRYERMPLPHSFLFRCESQPPPLRGTSFHRKEGESCPCTKAFPREKESDARIPLSRTVISSASEKSFSFALKWCMRANGSGKPDTPRMWDTVLHANG